MAAAAPKIPAPERVAQSATLPFSQPLIPFMQSALLRELSWGVHEPSLARHADLHRAFVQPGCRSAQSLMQLPGPGAPGPRSWGITTVVFRDVRSNAREWYLLPVSYSEASAVNSGNFISHFPSVLG